MRLKLLVGCLIVPVTLVFCPVALPQASDPKPQDATKAILAAFDKYEVVGMGAAIFGVCLVSIMRAHQRD